MRRIASTFCLMLALACEPECPEGFEGALDQCVMQKPHPCEMLPSTKMDDLGDSVMSRIDVSKGKCFWMDQTEVTVAAYSKWIEDEPKVDEWAEDFCVWKGQRSDPTEDSSLCEPALSSRDQDPFGASKPIRCIDFCDAEAFCRYAGKHLCHENLTSGTGSPRSYAPEWLLACDNARTTIFPWGDDEDPTRCQTEQEASGCDNSSCGPTSVGQRSRCRGKQGLFDMIGNVAEWAHSCSDLDPQKPTCSVRGGSYREPTMACSYEDVVVASARRPDIGFRCCADLTPAERAQVPGSEE